MVRPVAQWGACVWLERISNKFKCVVGLVRCGFCAQLVDQRNPSQKPQIMSCGLNNDVQQVICVFGWRAVRGDFWQIRTHGGLA